MKTLVERIVMVLPQPPRLPMTKCGSCGKPNEPWRTSCISCGTRL